MLRNFKIWQRLLLVAISFSIPIVLLLVLLVEQQNIAIDFAKKERDGVLFLKPTRSLLNHLIQHRDMHISNLSGETSFKDKLASLQSDIDSDIAALKTQSDELSDYTKTAEQLKVISDSWAELKTKLPGMTSLAIGQSVEQHARVIKTVTRFLVIMGNESNLVLDPDVDSYYCMDAVIFRLPKLSNDISQLRSQGVGTLLSNLGTDGTRRENLKVLSGIVEESLGSHRDNIEYGLLANGDLDSKLRPLVEASASNTKNFISMVSEKIVVAANVDLKPLTLFDSAGLAIDSNFGLYDSTASALDELLRVRIDGFTSTRNLELGLVVLSFAISILLGVFLLRSITQPIGELSRIAEKISLGDLDEEIKLVGKDELTELSEKFKRMQTSLKSAMEHLDSKDPL